MGIPGAVWPDKYRPRTEPERTAEIDALTTHIAKLDKEYADAAAQDEAQ